MSARDHLRGIVALWLTNGNKPIDGANDTRSDFFSGGWYEAQCATEELVDAGLCAWANEADATSAWEEGGSYSNVAPTAKGIAEAMS